MKIGGHADSAEESVLTRLAVPLNVLADLRGHKSVNCIDGSSV